jgi:hypothetical protein
MSLILSAIAVVLLVVVPPMVLTELAFNRRAPFWRKPRSQPEPAASPSGLRLIQGTGALRARSYERPPLAVVRPFIHPCDTAFSRNRLQGYLVAGHHQLNHHGLARTLTYRYLSTGQPLRMVREADCTADPNAICLYAEHGYLRGVDLGFFRGPRAVEIARQMNKGARCEARVLRVTSGLFGRDRRLFIEVNLVTSAPRSIQA